MRHDKLETHLKIYTFKISKACYTHFIYSSKLQTTKAKNLNTFDAFIKMSSRLQH